MLSNLKREITNLKIAADHRTVVNVRMMEDGSIWIAGQTYRPSPTAVKLHNDTSRIKAVIGPYGSGKSSMCCAEILSHTCKMPPCNDGVRRARWAIIRNTYPELHATTIRTWLDWMEPLGKIVYSAPIVYTAIFNDGNGLIELEIWFISFEHTDVKKLKSLEITGAWINEASELPYVLMMHLPDRIGRYPAKRHCEQKFNPEIILDSNPPDTDHWLYNLFELERPKGYVLYKQPSGLLEDNSTEDGYVTNPEAENIENLPHDYYLNLTRGKPTEYIRVYGMGQYGAVIEGRRVYDNYNDDLHSADHVLPLQNVGLLLGLDFGMTPACLIVQLSPLGQLRILKEFTTDRLSLRELLQQVVKPYLSTEYRDYVIETVAADPAGKQDSQTDAKDCFDILREEGFSAYGAYTNAITPRIDSVKYFLNRLVDGSPALLVSRSGCPTLRKGFIGGYNYKRVRIATDERYYDKPDKNRYSHVHDALQYIALHLVREVKEPQKIDAAQFRYHGTGWN
jgi:Phage terminase large subunit